MDNQQLIEAYAYLDKTCTSEQWEAVQTILDACERPGKQLIRLEAKICNYVEALNEKYEGCFYFSRGKRFYKIIMRIGIIDSVWCFVDMEGNLYKAKSWSKPAVGVRGHISNPILELQGFYAK